MPGFINEISDEQNENRDTQTSFGIPIKRQVNAGFYKSVE